MSKKDYATIAQVLANHRMTTTTNQWVLIMQDLAYAFKLDNPRFDEKKFKEACFSERIRA